MGLHSHLVTRLQILGKCSATDPKIDPADAVNANVPAIDPGLPGFTQSQKRDALDQSCKLSVNSEVQIVSTTARDAPMNTSRLSIGGLGFSTLVAVAQ